MHLRPGGIDIFYIDESHDRNLYVVSAVAVPFLRNVDGVWHITWPDHLEGAKSWRKRIADNLKIPMSKELHAVKLIGGRGNMLYGSRQLKGVDAVDAYSEMLMNVDFIPDGSVLTVCGTRGPEMFGHGRLERVLYALFQRMRSQCVARRVNGMVFFDQGHPEYRRLYRRAMVNLPTGSLYGDARNLPLDMFIKDGNEKNSAHCLFTQLSDLIAYAALTQIRNERGELSQEQQDLGIGNLYQALPMSVRNLRASRHAGGIVRMG